MELPVYELKISTDINDNAEVDFVALVDKPAIERNFLSFKDEFIDPSKGEKENDFMQRCISYVTGEGKDNEQAVIKELGISKHYDNNSDVVRQLGNVGNKFEIGFSIQSEDQHIISGPLMIPNKLMYRNNKKFGEHYVKFSKETVKEIAIKYAKNGYQSNVNLMHNDNSIVSGITLFESFITDKERGIAPLKGFEDCEDGTWFGSFYVENKSVWEDVKSGKYKGFSVEGIFNYVPTEDSVEQLLRELSESLNVPV
jgi:hypothetical protein